MIEKGFVDSLHKQFKREYPGADITRPSDNFSLGLPDLWVCIPVPNNEDGHPVTWLVAIEAKQLRPLMEDPFHKGRRRGLMLKHPFSGPQISKLRHMKKAGADAFGLVRASSDMAFRIEPEHIPGKTGNFTHEELIEVGVPVRRIDGAWQWALRSV